MSSKIRAPIEIPVDCDTPKLKTVIQFNGEKIKLTDSDDKKKSQSTLLVEIGSESKLFHDRNNDAYAEISTLDIKTTLPIRSRDFREHLGRRLYSLTQKGANAKSITDAISTLEARAKIDGEEMEVCIRTHKNDQGIFIDMGDTDRRVIHIDKKGWRYTSNAPVKFVKKRGMIAFPSVGTLGGNLSILKKYINVDDDDFSLIMGWILCAISSVKPYPVLIMMGDQGSGKTTACRVIRSLVDPSSVKLRSQPKDTRDLLVSAANTHVIALDNLSGLSNEMSDNLCRLSTGGGFDMRSLYTDNEQVLIDIQKPIIVNGITDIASRPDLAERSLIVTMRPINPSIRQTEAQFERDFNRDFPAILTGLFDCISLGLKNFDKVILKRLPRMADAATWVTACEIGMGCEGNFIRSHSKNQDEASLLTVEGSPVGSAIVTLVTFVTHESLFYKPAFMSDDDTGTQTWHGSPTELMKMLSAVAGDAQARSRAWPASHKGLKNVITRLKPNLKKLGINIKYERTRSSRIYIIETSRI